jgi:two-component system, sensor histidine kinase and response regulator
LLSKAVSEGRYYDLAVLDLMMPGMDGFELARSIKSDSLLAALPLVLLTSFGQRGDGETARQAGIAAYLTKPVRQSHLFDCLIMVINNLPGASNLHKALPGARVVARHNSREPRAISRKLILLAEDNIVNQKVAMRQIENLGFRVDTVANGREAIEALTRIPYDLVLMDCQMPEMDGYEASVEIRLHEANGQHIPIIAMTAHALEGDRQKCLDSGMDDYISKPVSTDDLARLLDLWLNPTTTTTSTERIEPTELSLAGAYASKQPG